MTNFAKISEDIQKTHASIISVPQNYGQEFAFNQLKLQKTSEIIKVYPRIHDNQKTEIINADDISEIWQKVRGTSLKPQFFIIFNAEKMNETAQNKFLKLLEEPRDNLHFILITENLSDLIVTVKSRTQIFYIKKISTEDSLRLLSKSKIEDQKKQQIIFLADGLPDEIQKLAKNRKYFDDNLDSMNKAKILFSNSEFEKIVLINEVKTDRNKALDILTKYLMILEKTVSDKNANQISKKLSNALRAYKNIQKNGNIRLSMLELTL